jgi:hypothetical protein
VEELLAKLEDEARICESYGPNGNGLEYYRWAANALRTVARFVKHADIEDAKAFMHKASSVLVKVTNKEAKVRAHGFLYGITCAHGAIARHENKDNSLAAYF